VPDLGERIATIQTALMAGVTPVDQGDEGTGVGEDALRERLARRAALPSPEPVRLVTVSGNGLLPGVDLDDSAALRELMDAAP